MKSSSRVHGITVYLAREEKGRWRAVWYEDGKRQQCEASSEEKLAARLDKVTERLAAGAPNRERPGADLIKHYLDPDRHPVDEWWSRKHAHTQRRLCERFAVPVIGVVACQDIKTSHMQKIVNAARAAPGSAVRPHARRERLQGGDAQRRRLMKYGLTRQWLSHYRSKHFCMPTSETWVLMRSSWRVAILARR